MTGRSVASHHIEAIAREESDDGLERLQGGAAADVAVALPWAVHGLRNELRHLGGGRHACAVGCRGILVAHAGQQDISILKTGSLYMPGRHPKLSRALRNHGRNRVCMASALL